MERRELLMALPALAIAGLPMARGAASASGPDGSVEDYFRNDGYAGVGLSPDGKSLVALIPIAGRRNVAVVDLTTRKATAITAIPDRDVLSVRWINNDRLVYDLFDLQSGLGEQRPSGLFAINKDGSELKQLASPSINGPNYVAAVYRFTAYVTNIPESHDIIAAANEPSADSIDLYRIDTKSGRRTLLTFRRPEYAQEWLLDSNRVPRVVVCGKKGTTNSLIFYRESADSDWIKLVEFDDLSNEGFEPLAFGPDGTLYVAARAGGDRAAIYIFDVASKQLGERLIAHKEFDFAYGNFGRSGNDELFTSRGRILIVDRLKKKLVGIRNFAEREEFYWFDDEWAKLHAMVEATLPGHVNRLSRTTDQTSILVYSYSDKDPGRWYLLNPEKRSLEEILLRRPWIHVQQQGERRFVRYQARDGSQVPAYLTLPSAIEAKHLPLVVLVHGGPFLRGEFWLWDAEAEFLASRGYAVLQADYRGSEGYGWAHYAAGRRQWGRSMQDDLTDGVRSLVADGLVDEKRVAIMGGSYGGYATVMGLAKDPDLYRCGIDIAGVTDLEMMGDATWSDMRAERPEFQKWFAAHVGNLDTEREGLRATSPYLLASRIKRPVLIIHGADDVRVPIQHANRMRSALEDAKVECEWVVYKDEAHGFLREDNRFDLYGRVERFLAKHMAPTAT